MTESALFTVPGGSQKLPAVFQYSLTVRPSDIDGQGHASNVVFVKWMQDAAVAHSTIQGWDASRYLQIGASWVVRRHTIRYEAPAFESDPIVVQTWVSRIRKVTSIRQYRVYRSSTGEQLAEAETDWAFVSRERGVPIRIPEEFRSSFPIIETSPAHWASE